MVAANIEHVQLFRKSEICGSDFMAQFCDGFLFMIIAMQPFISSKECWKLSNFQSKIVC